MREKMGKGGTLTSSCELELVYVPSVPMFFVCPHVFRLPRILDMIEPYETALRNAFPGFSKLGFSLLRNTEYIATFSDGTYSIEFSADRYYHPQLSGVICDPTGKKFEIGLVWQILDPLQNAEAMAALKAIRQRFGLDERGTSKEVRLQGIAKYLQVMLDQLLRFFAAHRERVFAVPNEYEAEYTVRSNALMAKYIKVRSSLEGLPNWRVEVKEASAGVYKATAVHASGPKIELTGTDQKRLIAEVKASAAIMELDIAKKTSQPRTT